MMTATEGVIQYQLVFERTPLVDVNVSDLEEARCVLKAAGLLGQSPDRYNGLGFGNLSRRRSGNRFLISGSQTGHLDTLGSSDYAEVIEADLAENRIVARGGTPPSSESLTHAAIYRARPDVGAVIHVHDPVIWRRASQLSLPVTGADTPYGTPAMALEVQGLVCGPLAAGSCGVFVMPGHRDGVVAFGPELSGALSTLMVSHHLAKSS